MRPRVFRLCYTLHEPMFYACRELGTQYLSEPVLSSYCQPYALGWVHSAYHLEGEQVTCPAYPSELAPLAARGIYITPAHCEKPPRMHTERFNALGEGYRSRMDQGAVVDDLAVLLTESGKGRAINRPQQGSIRFLSRGNELVSWLLSVEEPPAIPRWVRLGKTMAKAKVECVEVSVRVQTEGEFRPKALLNPVDLPEQTRPLRFDLIGIRPVPLLRDATLAGPYLDTSDGLLPAGMAWRFATESASKVT